MLGPGTVINDSILISSKPYLQNLKLTYEGGVEDQPVIAKISHKTFVECMYKTD